MKCAKGHEAGFYVKADGRMGQCKECAGIARRARYVKNKEKERAQMKAYAVANKDTIRAYHKSWVEENTERYNERRRAWEVANPHIKAANTRKRQAAKRGATPKWLTDHQLLEMQHKYLLAKIHESVTGFKWHVDHIVPLQGGGVCGLHVPWNLQVIPAKDNLKKHAKFEAEK